MKKMMIMLAVVGAVFAAKAAFVDWSYTGTDSQVGYNVYVVIGATAATDWANESAVAAAAIDTATVASLGRGKYGIASRSAGGINKGDSYYLVVASGDNYAVSSVYSGGIYDPSAQESSPGATVQATMSNLSNKFGGDTPVDPTPEPTSGLLLLVGGAMLALRRKQK